MFINDTDYLDQHFLIDNAIINKLIDSSNLKITDNVIEIGPGKCNISEIIARKVNSLLLIEKDKRLEHFINVLKDKYQNVNAIYGNVLDTYLPKCDKIISALPYSITEPFVEKLLRCDFDEAILIVGQNFSKNVNENSLNKLSLITRCFFNFEYICDVYPESFDPKPRVMSSIVKLKKNNRYDLIVNPKLFIMRELLYNRNRKLKNNLIESLIEYHRCIDIKLTKKESKSIVSSFNIDSSILNKEMEQLSNKEYEIIYNSLNLK